jgi:hypothetical protein
MALRLGPNIGKANKLIKSMNVKHRGLTKKRQIKSTKHHEKPKPKDDTQIPRPDLRFERKQRSKGNGTRAQQNTKTQDLPSDTMGMSHHVIKNLHYDPIGSPEQSSAVTLHSPRE